MKHLIVITFLAATIFAKVNVVTSYKYIANLTQYIGADKVKVSYLANPKFDPHFITPKPSYISKLRRADLLISNGGDLEIGWLPPLVDSANNSKLSTNHIKLFNFVKTIEVPHTHEVTRANGDIHPLGNPHFHLSFKNIPIVAEAIFEWLAETDSKNKEFYKENLVSFQKKWESKATVWKERLKDLKGAKVVQYHRVFSYLLRDLSIDTVTTLEEKPGIQPSTKYLEGVIKKLKQQKTHAILQDVYHNQKMADFVSRHTDVKVVVLPHDIDSQKNTENIFELFESIVKKLENI